MAWIVRNRATNGTSTERGFHAGAIFAYENLHWLFLAMGIFMGVMYVAVTPPLQTPDEPVHFFRAYQVSVLDTALTEGKPGQFGALVPTGLADLARALEPVRDHPDRKLPPCLFSALRQHRLEGSQRSFVPGVPAYPASLYLPQAGAIALGRWFLPEVLSLMYLGRMANLAFYLFLAWGAIRIAPLGKEVLLLVALMPMALYQAASLSVDATTNGFVLLFVAIVLRYTFGRPTFSTRAKDVLLFLFCSICLGLVKQAYASLILAFLSVPHTLFKTKLARRLVFSGMGLCAFGGALYSALTVMSAPVLFSAGTCPREQLSFLLRHPYRYYECLIDTGLRYKWYYAVSLVGNFGWMDCPLPDAVVGLYLATMLVVALSYRSRVAISSEARACWFFAALVSTVLVFTALYLGCTPVGYDVIIGVQGRYFIPIIPLLLLSGHNERLSRAAGRAAPGLASATAAVSFCVAVCTIADRYYDGW